MTKKTNHKTAKKNYAKKPNGKNATGAPSDYKPEYCKQMIEYFKVGSEEDYPEKLPTFTFFALKLGVTRQTLHNWKDLYPEFLDAFTRCKGMQREIWMQNALTNKYNPQFAKFVGINVIGWRDKKEHELTGKDGESLSISVSFVDGKDNG